MTILPIVVVVRRVTAINNAIIMKPHIFGFFSSLLVKKAKNRVSCMQRHAMAHRIAYAAQDFN